jgi:3-oxoacyl-[acyl-carrier protein] reductase
MRLENKITIITGGAGGIGREITESFLKEGATVLIIDKAEYSAQKSKGNLFRKCGKGLFFIRGDVSLDDEVKRIIDNAYAEFSRIDILVNCAGIYEDCPFLNMDGENWDRTIKVNLYGCFYCTRAVASYMQHQGSGSIINISSIGGQTAPSVGHAHYAASKAGVIGFTKAVAKELAPFGIRVNSICPGVTKGTRMGDRAIRNVGEEYAKNIPLGRFALPIDIAYGAIYLASDESKYITGATLSINGGAFMS